eukprot:gene13817-15889_t
MFKGKAARPTGVNSISDSNEAEKLALTSHKSTWAPLVFLLGPCFSSKKVQFGRPVEHISYRDNSKLYESISTDTAVLAWSNAAHEGTLKGLRQTIIHGISMYDRLQSDLCLETNTLQIFIPEVQADARAESITRLKWAVKYNPEVISFDEGNLLVDTYDVQEGLMFAHKYGRKIRIARWGGEIPDVPLCELLYRSLLDFLHTGRYVDCDYVARSRTFAETKSVNGLGELATPEDIAFDYGYVLDKDGFITKLHKPLTPILGKKFFVTDLFRIKNPASPTAARTEKDTKSPRRMSSFRSAFTSKTSAESAPDDLNALERQIQRELGINESTPPPTSGSVVSADIGAITEKESEGEGSLALIVAEAARNAQKVRRETNWVAFLNHKVPSSVTATYIRSKKGTTLPKESQTQLAPASSTRVESSKETDSLAGLGSYTYGLGEKKPYKPAQSSAADAVAVTGPKEVWAETAEILAPPTVPKQEALSKRNTKGKAKEDVPSHVKHEVQPFPPPPAQAATEEKVEKKALTIVIPNSHTEDSKSKARHTTVAVEESHGRGISAEKQAQPRREEKIGGMASPQTEKEETAVNGKLAVGSAAKFAPTIAPPSFSSSDNAVNISALPISVPVQISAVPGVELAHTPALPAVPVVEPAADRTAPASKEELVPSVPSNAPAVVPSPRFSPRARLVPTLSDIDMSNETSNATASPHGDTVSKNVVLEQKGTVLDSADQAADLAVAAALAKAHSFKTHGATSERSVEPIASPRITTTQPSVAVVHRPVLRAPSTMQMSSMVPVSKLPPPQLPHQTLTEPEFVPVSVKEKKDVIETRIRSQRTPLDAVTAGSPRNAKHAHQTQSSQRHNIPDMVNPIEVEVPMPPQFSAAGPTGRDHVAQSSAIEANAKAPPAATIAPPLKPRQATVGSDEKQRETTGSGNQSTSKPMTQKSLQKKWAFSTMMQQQVR